MTPSVGIDVASLVASRVQSLQEYAPEPVTAVAQRWGLPVGQLIKLDANENPYGPTQHALDVMRGFYDYHLYPDAISRELRQAIGAYLGVDPETVVVGNGSDELIELLMRIFRPDPQGGGIEEIINCPPTFGMYAFYGSAHDMKLITVPRDAAFKLDMEAIRQICQDGKPRLLFACSPNNPDGQLLDKSVLKELLDLPLLVVLDEAYVEFSGGSRADWVAQRENLIVLRTFSKWAGLAGLRVGYGIFPESLMTAAWRLKSPYNVNCASQVAAKATLDGLDEAQERIDKIVAERERFAARLAEFPFLRVYESQANFVFCRVRGLAIDVIRQAMERRGIILRYFERPGLEDGIRISVGTPMQDQAVLMILQSLI